jgi:hypothetical protein
VRLRRFGRYCRWICIPLIRELIGICIGKITEADGKLNTRFRSVGSLDATRETKLQHEHVLEMKKLISDLIDRRETVESVIEKAIGCVVTRDEHSILSAVSKKEPELHGWERYKRAGIRVFDLEENKELQFEPINALNT